MAKIIPFPGVSMWDLVSLVCEVEEISRDVERIVARLKYGSVSTDDLAMAIRRLQQWSEKLADLLIVVSERV